MQQRGFLYCLSSTEGKKERDRKRGEWPAKIKRNGRFLS
nr:MAG TPA: hypothetical protein [Caudoviricetes sp.]